MGSFGILLRFSAPELFAFCELLTMIPSLSELLISMSGDETRIILHVGTSSFRGYKIFLATPEAGYIDAMFID